MMVQENKAFSYSHKAQLKIFDFHKVMQMLWPGNLPDLNMIEPCWLYLKKQTTIRGATTF